jgi:hypothetical protein
MAEAKTADQQQLGAGRLAIQSLLKKNSSRKPTARASCRGGRQNTAEQVLQDKT